MSLKIYQIYIICNVQRQTDQSDQRGQMPFQSEITLSGNVYHCSHFRVNFKRITEEYFYNFKYKGANCIHNYRDLWQDSKAAWKKIRL